MKVFIAMIAPVALATSLAGCTGESESTQNEHVEDVKQAQQPAAPPILTFSVKLSSKLFINGVPTCGANPNIFGGLASFAAWRAFCAATAAKYAENPPADNAPVPLDARILGVATARWNCQAGNPTPVGPALAAGGGSVGGMEGPLVGIANAMGIRDNLLLNGTWGMVTSGRPNPIAEPAFQAIFPRVRPDIWNKIATTTTCGVDAQGRPTATSVYNFTGTWFPSHRVWRRSPMANPAAAVLFNLPQRALSDLWALPAVPAP
jgi:hypothetical protein